MRYWAGAATSPGHIRADHSGRLGRAMYNLRRFAHVDGLKAIACERPSPEHPYLAGREFRNDHNG